MFIFSEKKEVLASATLLQKRFHSVADDIHPPNLIQTWEHVQPEGTGTLRWFLLPTDQTPSQSETSGNETLLPFVAGVESHTPTEKSR